MVEGLDGRIAPTHGSDVEGFIERQRRAAHEGVLRLDQIAGVQVERTNEPLGCLDRCRQVVLAANRLEHSVERIQPIAARNEQRVAGGGQDRQVGVQGTHVCLEMAFLLLLALRTNSSRILSSMSSAWSVRLAARSGK
jgi:hypothetical protein